MIDELNYSIQDFDDEIRDAYVRLLPHQESAVAKGKLDWKFRHNPAGLGRIAVCRNQGSDIVGLNAFMAGRFCGIDQADITGYQSMDTIVAPEARGQGVFGHLINTFYEQSGANFVYGFPNMSSSPGFFGKLGWALIGAAPMLVKPLRSGIFLKRLHRLMPDIALPQITPAFAQVDELNRFDPVVDHVWEQFCAMNNITIALRRDHHFLNWRLCDHPTETYVKLGWENRAFATGYVTEKHGGRVGYIMDAFGETAHLAKMIGSLCQRLQQQDPDAIFAWCLPGTAGYAAHRRAGFFPIHQRIRPIKLNFGARALTATLDRAEAKSGWHISYLDSDTV